MSGAWKVALIILGAMAAVLVVSQLVMGLLMINGRADLKVAHQHSGYLTAAVTLAYIAMSLTTIGGLRAPERK